MKVIKDPTFENHYIQVDDYNYSVYETKVSKAKQNEYSGLVGHYSSMPLALKAIACNLSKQCNTLNSYISRLEETHIKFENLKLN